MAEVTIQIMARSESGQLYVDGMGVGWSEKDRCKPVQKTWKGNPPSVDGLLELLARYKLWCAKGEYLRQPQFEVRGGKDSLANVIHTLISNNAARDNHWAPLLFGVRKEQDKVGKERSICRLRDLINPTKPNGEYVVAINSGRLRAENITITVNDQPLDNEGLKNLVAGFGDTDAPDPSKACRVEEGIKMIDLRGWEASRSEEAQSSKSLVILTDVYAFSPPPERPERLQFYCATKGHAVRSRSISHPSDFRFEPCRDPLKEHRHLENEGKLVWIGPDDALRRGELRVENSIEFIGAFKDEAEEWFHTHVSFPTDQITFLVSFPPGKPCQSCWGLVSVGHGSRFEHYKSQPTRSPDGHLVYWQVRECEPNETYEIRWKW